VASGDAAPSAEAKRLIAEIRDRDRAIWIGYRGSLVRNAIPAGAPLRRHDDDEDFSTLLDDMEAARGDLVSLLINLSLKDWARSAVDEAEGEITLADEVEQHVEFDELQRLTLRETISNA
jgi:hypothetical protein